jgi:hypothetical protein
VTRFCIGFVLVSVFVLWDALADLIRIKTSSTLESDHCTLWRTFIPEAGNAFV